MDRRSQSADADHAVEAGPDDRVHADDLRAGLSVRRRRDDPDRAVLDEGSDAADADRRGRRAARLQGGAPPAAAADREPVHGLQGRLASGRGGRARRGGRVAVDQEGGDARVQESEEGRRALPRRRQPGARSFTGRSRSQIIMGGQAVETVHARARRARAAEDHAARRRRWATPTWPNCRLWSTRRSCR